MAAISLSDRTRRSRVRDDTRAVGSIRKQNHSKRARAAPRRPAGPATHAEWRKNGEVGEKRALGSLGPSWPLLAGYPPAACTLHRRGLLRAV